MQSQPFLNIDLEIILPSDSEQMVKIKQKLNEMIKKLDEAYRLLHMDIRVMDFRELPPHASIDHAPWKWYTDPATGDLQLWHRTDAIWSKTYWSVVGDLTRWPSV